MRKISTIIALLFSILAYSQNNSNEQLKSEIDKIKTEIIGLKSDIQSVKSENIYLKQVFNINKPILEQQQNNTSYTITKVIGNRKDKIIYISMLVESKDENKGCYFQNSIVVDLEGNQYEIDIFKSLNQIPHLTLNVPLLVKFAFKDIIGEPKILKLFSFSTTNEPDRDKYNLSNKSNQEFRDLNVTWE